MSQRISAMLAIAGKDWRVLWPLVVITVLAVGAVAATMSGALAKPMPSQFRQVLSFSPIVAFLSAGVLSFSLAQQDPIPGVANDWLTRPVRRMDLLIAKLGFLLVTVALPIALLIVGIALANSNAQEDAVSWKLVLGILWTVGGILALFPVLLAVAALTKNLIEGMAVAFVLFLAVVLNGVAGMFMPFGYIGDSSLNFTGFGWIVGLASYWTVAIATVAVLALLYGARKVLAGRIVAGVAAVAFIFISGHFPWSAALAVQRIATGTDPAPLTVGARPACIIVPDKPNLPEHLISYDARSPIAVFKVSGAPAGSRVLGDRLQITSQEQEKYRSSYSFPRQEAVLTPSGDMMLSIRLPGGNQPLEGHPSKSEALFFLTLLDAAPAFEAPLDTKRRKIPSDGGWCQVKASAEVKRTEVRCTFENARHPVASLEGKTLGCNGCFGEDSGRTRMWFPSSGSCRMSFRRPR